MNTEILEGIGIKILLFVAGVIIWGVIIVLLFTYLGLLFATVLGALAFLGIKRAIEAILKNRTKP